MHRFQQYKIVEIAPHSIPNRLTQRTHRRRENWKKRRKTPLHGSGWSLPRIKLPWNKYSCSCASGITVNDMGTPYIVVTPAVECQTFSHETTMIKWKRHLRYNADTICSPFSRQAPWDYAICTAQKWAKSMTIFPSDSWFADHDEDSHSPPPRRAAARRF